MGDEFSINPDGLHDFAGKSTGEAGKIRTHGETFRSKAGAVKIGQGGGHPIEHALERAAERITAKVGKDVPEMFAKNREQLAAGVKHVAEETRKTDDKHAKDFTDLHERHNAGHRPGRPGEGGPGGKDGGPSSVRENNGPGRPAEGTRKCTKAGDPVDVVSGQMLMSAADLTLPGLLPLVLRRAHASDYTGGHWFGRSWASTLDQRVEIDQAGIHYAGEDTEVLHYPHPSEPGRRALPVEGARWELTWDRDEDVIRIEDPETGWTRHFAASATSRPAGAEIRPLSALTDRAGHRIDYLHDQQGRPTEVRHSGGYRVAVDLIHTAAGPRIEALRLLDGTHGGLGTTVIRYRYDARGRLTDIVNSSGLPLVYGLDSDDRITSWTDRNGYWYRYAYDPATGRVASGTGEGGHLNSTFAYDTDRRITTVTNSLGHRTEYHYDANHHLTRVVDPQGHAVLTSYDRYGRLRARTDELGRTTSFTLDGNGDLVRIDRPDGTSLSVDYNELRLPVRTTAADGAVREYGYDGRGNLLTVTDPLGATSRYGYDEQGHRISHTDPLGHTVHFRTDPAGLPVQATAALGNTVRLRRDAFGRPVSVTDPLGGTVHQEWTVEGLLTARVTAEGAREEWSYDPEGNLTRHRNQIGLDTLFAYGAFAAPRSRTDPDGTRYEFTHDTELRLTTVTNPQGLTWSYAFDATGCLTAETDFNGRTLTYRSDPTGRLVERTNGAGQSVTLSRDVAGRVVASRTDDGVLTTYGYDPAGRLIRAASPDCTLEYRYDRAGRVVAESTDGHMVLRAYDQLGQCVRRTTPTGAVSVWTYDANGLPAGLTTAGGSLGFQYDRAGRETTRTLGAGAALTQSWDAAHRLSAQAIWTACGAEQADGSGYRQLQARAYTYRPDGHPTEIVDQTRGTRQYELDPAGRATTVQAASWWESYAYDTLGNLTHAVYPGEHNGSLGGREYAGTLVRRAGRTSYEHDGQGRAVRTVRRTLSGQSRAWRFSWDADDRLTTVVTPDSTVWRYRYDALGRRVEKARLDADGSVAERTLFSWDGTNLAEQVTLLPGQASAVSWDWDPGTYRAATQVHRSWRTRPDGGREEADRAFYAVITDLVGTPTELVTLDGRIAWRATTSLWGRPVGGGDQSLCPLRFPGQYHDPETGLDYNLARYYDAETAGYLSPDPLGLPPAPNHHAYVDNPLGWTDPLGLAALGHDPIRIFDDSTYSKHKRSSGSSAKGEIGRAPADGQTALDRSIDLGPGNPNVFRRLGVDHDNNEIVVLDRHDYETDKDGNIVKEIYHGHVQAKYPSDSVSQGDLTKLKKAGMIDNVKKQRVLPPPPPTCEEK